MKDSRIDNREAPRSIQLQVDGSYRDYYFLNNNTSPFMTHLSIIAREMHIVIGRFLFNNPHAEATTEIASCVVID
jgi:hypothetical protein